ncbi:hypothetical protein Bbelb_332580 [Branchiostoma belcheri]|nr:hypothetical protein Bbelb_332580 [Branchiostoma belcheri]
MWRVLSTSSTTADRTGQLFVQLSKVYFKPSSRRILHCQECFCAISRKTGISVQRFDFSDPQAGKDICDRKIASMKTHIRRYVNEKHDVLTADDMKEALESHGGIKGCRSHTSHITAPTGGAASLLFYCPEPGCVAAFSSTNKLEDHMDVGQHLKELEPPQSRAPGEESGVDIVGFSRVVSEGWAIRAVKGGQRMSDNVKAYLTDIFNKGARTGQKADAVQVAQEMQHVRGSDGKLLFQPSEWRTAKQITSFFARLSAAQRQQESTESVTTDMEAIEEEGEWQALRKTVYTSIDYSHPIQHTKGSIVFITPDFSLAE